MKTRSGYLIKRGRTFHAVWTVAGKKFMRTTGQTERRKAQTRLTEIMQPFLVEDEVRTLESIKARIEGAKGELAAIEEGRNPPLTIAQTWNTFLSSPRRPDSGKRTLEDYAGCFALFRDWLSEQHPATAAIRDVGREIASEYAAHLVERRVAACTYNKTLNSLALIFRVVAEKARLAVNPWLDIPRKRLTTQTRRELTVEELRRVCEKAAGELRLLFAVGVYSGLRLGDAATLRWGEIDLVRNIARRIPMKTARRSGKPVLLPIHPVLGAMLAEIPEGDRRDYVMPETAALYLRDDAALSKVIQDHFQANGVRTQRPGTGFEWRTDEDGKPKRLHTGQRAIVEVGFHSLRHTFVSLCRAGNAPLSVVESLVGHSNPAMTRHYTHTGESGARAAVAALPDVTGGELKALPPAVRETMAANGAHDVSAAIREAVDALKAMTCENWSARRDAVLAALEVASRELEPAPAVA